MVDAAPSARTHGPPANAPNGRAHLGGQHPIRTHTRTWSKGVTRCKDGRQARALHGPKLLRSFSAPYVLDGWRRRCGPHTVAPVRLPRGSGSVRAGTPAELLAPTTTEMGENGAALARNPAFEAAKRTASAAGQGEGPAAASGWVASPRAPASKRSSAERATASTAAVATGTVAKPPATREHGKGTGALVASACPLPGKAAAMARYSKARPNRAWAR